MNKQEFIKKLGKSISGLPEADRHELLSDYEEHFRAGMEEGKSEEEIVRALGSPAQIARDVELDSYLSDDRQKRGRTIARSLFASATLGIFNAIFIVGPYAGLVGGMAGLWAGAVALAVSGVGAIVILILSPFIPAMSIAGLRPLFVIIAGIGTSALGVLATLGMWELSRLFARMTRRYVLFNVRIARGESK